MNDQKGTQAAGNKGTPEKNQLKELSKREMEKVQGGGRPKNSYFYSHAYTIYEV